MSLILDALNRSRSDADQVPGLATQHPVEHITAGGRQYLLWAALLIALVLIGALVWERSVSPVESVPDAGVDSSVAELSRNIGSAVTAVTTELKARAATPQTKPSVTPDSELQEPVERPMAAVPESVPGSASTKGPGQGVVSVPAVVTGSPAAASENSAVAQIYQQRDLAAARESESERQAIVQPSPKRNFPDAGGTASAVTEEQSVDIEAILELAREEMENADLDEHPVPLLSDLSQQTKDDIPTVYYQRHDYSSTASQSSVTLNGKKVKMGGSAFSGMKVDEILPDSVVLNYRGTQFRLRALNSWINL